MIQRCIYSVRHHASKKKLIFLVGRAEENSTYIYTVRGMILLHFSENLFSQTFCSHHRMWPPTANHSNFWGQALTSARAAHPTSAFIGKAGKAVCTTGAEKLGEILGVRSQLETSQILPLSYMQKKIKVPKIWREWGSLVWLNRGFCVFLLVGVFRYFSVCLSL